MAARGHQGGHQVSESQADSPVQPAPAQICHLHLPDAETGAWPVIGAFRDHYMVSWPGGRVVVGATRETGSGFRPRTSVGGIMEVRPSTARRPEPPRRRRAWPKSGSAAAGKPRRPPDAGGPAPASNGLLIATGHGPSGLLLGPLSGKLVADAVIHGHADSPPRPFRRRPLRLRRAPTLSRRAGCRGGRGRLSRGRRCASSSAARSARRRSGPLGRTCPDGAGSRA